MPALPSAVGHSERGAAAAPESAAPPRSQFRPDIEGLRAIAVGLVLLYHAGITFVPGGFVGVDVFFVISGFLITGMLLREVQRTGRVSLTSFYAKRVRRLLPAASLVLVASAMLVWAVGPETQRSVYGGDVIASALSLVNWRFAGRAIDYQAQGIAASPVQHFWSLSVEEQYYFLWPILLLIVALFVRRWHTSVIVPSVIVLLVISATSFVWSVIYSDAAPASAFFVTTTRLWELGVGALVATGALLWTRLPAWSAIALGWGGLVAVVGSALVFGASSNWPGSLALVPTLGTAAIIIAGTRERTQSPALLRWKPALWLGGLSYSLYLWHWPLLVAAGWQWGELGQKRALLVVLIAVIPAWLSYKLVETPVRRAKGLAGSPRFALSVGANLAALGVIVGLLVSASTPRETPVLAAQGLIGAETLEFDGAKVTGIDASVSDDPYSPAAANASEDRPMAYANDCHRDQRSTEPAMCPSGKIGSDKRIVLAGDSKAALWSDALDAVANTQGWELVLATKSACHFADILVNDGDGRPYTSCIDYDANLLSQMLADPPDAVVVSQGASKGFDAEGELSEGAMRDALIQQWTTLEDAGIDVIVLLNNPSPQDLPAGGGQVPECVAEFSTSYDKCAFDRAGGVAASSAVTQLAAASAVPGIDVLDMTDVFCNETLCPPVIGNVLLYRQGTHITDSYLLSTTKILDSRLAAILEDA